MAAIDKTYGTNDQWLELYSWIIKSNNKRLLRKLYQYSGYLDEIRPICNTDFHDDYILIHQCPLEFVQERMKDVYRSNYEKLKSGELLKEELRFNKENYTYANHIRRKGFCRCFECRYAEFK